MIFRARLAFLLLPLLQTALAQAPTIFSPQGFGGGGYMYVPSISPHDPNHLFVNCDMGGIYRSTDGAQSFQMQHTESLVATVKGKIQFSSDPNILYVVRRSTSNLSDPLWRGELAKSSDGGATWAAMPDPTSTGVHRLEVDPGSTQRLLLNEYNQIFFSGNGGASWTSVFQGPNDQVWLGGAFWDGQNIYVGTNHGLLVSKNGGASFAIENHSGLPSGTGICHLAGAKAAGATRLFCIPATASEMYAWLEPLSFDGLRQGLFRMNYSTSAAWANARANIPADIELAWVDLARNNTQTVWADGADANGFSMTFKSTNGGTSWINVYQTNGNANIATGWAGAGGPFWLQQNEAALGLDVSDTDPNHVVRTRGEAEMTTDGGATWRSVYTLQNFLNPIGQPTPINKFYKSSGLDVTSAHHVFWKNDNEVFLANTDVGMTYSADAGNTWTWARNTFLDYGPVANNNWYRIVERPDNHHLYAAVSDLNDIYLGYRVQDWNLDAASGLVLRSTDGGTTFDTLYNFGHAVVWLEIDKNNPARMWASVVHSVDGGIYRSENGGATWAKLPPPPRTEGHPYNIVSLADGGLVVSFSARTLPDNETLSESSGVFFSADGGNTWQDRTAPAMRFFTKDIAVDPHDGTGNTWYATVWGRHSTWPAPNNQFNGGLYRSADRGQTWTRISEKSTAESLTIHPEKPGTAYLTVENDGLYFTENLDAANPVFERLASYPWWRPKRVFFKPEHPNEVWVTSMGGGLWKGLTNPAGTINYTASTEDFANPERGFYHYSDSNDPLVAADIAAWRNPHTPWQANYQVRATLVFRYFLLEDFINTPISTTFLNAMQQDFAAARQAGAKIIPRFAYTLNTDNGGCAYCPPYGDAPKNIVLQHIAQLKPILMANADVIATVQLGFIGIWGEGYYTDFFGDDSQEPYGLTAQNWSDRNEVITALLDALPPDRSIQVRYPQMKQKLVYGPTAPTSSAALSQAQAWQNSPIARIGHHNDCFLSSASDVGTYLNFDIVSNDFDTATLKPYTALDSRFVPVGGETCADWNPYSNCVGTQGGGAQNEMARMHWSYLNADYNNALNNDWVAGACIEEIKQRLGYRLELQSGVFSTEARPGQSISIKIDLKNKGFAAPFNPRAVWLLLRNTATGAIWNVELPDDPRTWLPGNQIHSIAHAFCIPEDMPTGNYEFLLHLADPYPALSNRPEYAIRLANENTWEASTGFNKLLHQIAINNLAGNPGCAGETCFQPAVPTAPNADFTANIQSGCAPLTVTFSSQYSQCFGYQWSFPGATPATSTEPNPTVLYQNPGTYDVSLSVTSAGGTASVTKNAYIAATSGPAISITTQGTPSFCSGGSVSLMATPGLSNYQWQFNGTPIGGAGSNSLSVSQPGAYWVSAQDAMGCLGSSAPFLVSENPLPVPSFSFSANGLDVLFSNNSTNATTYSWNFGDGSPASSAASPAHSFAAPGVYFVTLEASNADCGPINITLPVAVACNPPVVQISAGGSTQVCEGESVAMTVAGNFLAFNWYRDGLEIPGAIGPVFSAGSSGVYKAFATDAMGCGNFSNEITVEVSPLPTAEITSSAPDGSVCEGEAVWLHGSGGVGYHWSTPIGSQVEGQEIQMAAAGGADSGNYFLTVTDGSGCTATATYLLTVNTAPMLDIQALGPTSFSYGQSVALVAEGDLVSWFWGSGQTTSQIIVSDCGAYSVTGTDANGCTASSETVTVSVMPVITFTNDTLYSTPAGSYQWFLNGNPIQGAISQTFVPLLEGTYSVHVDCPGTGELWSNSVFVTIIATSEPGTKRLKIYPNPVSEYDSKLNLEMSGLGAQALTLVLTDLAGRELMRKTASHVSGKTFLETAGIQAGAYFVQVWQGGKMQALGVFLKV